MEFLGVLYLYIHAYKGHWLAYDSARRIPVWVAELLDKDMLHQNKTAERHQSNFKVTYFSVACISDVPSGRP